MNGAIQRFPGALLALLTIKASETPVSLEETVGASLEMLPFYVADRLESVSNKLVGTTTVGAFVQVPVPTGEYWLLWNVTAIVDNISAPASIKALCGYNTPDGVGITLGSMTAPVVSVAGEQFHVPGMAPQGLLLRPGSFVFAAIDVDPGAPTLDLTVRAAIARLSASS